MFRVEDLGFSVQGLDLAGKADANQVQRVCGAHGRHACTGSRRQALPACHLLTPTSHLTHKTIAASRKTSTGSHKTITAVSRARESERAGADALPGEGLRRTGASWHSRATRTGWPNRETPVQDTLSGLCTPGGADEAGRGGTWDTGRRYHRHTDAKQERHHHFLLSVVVFFIPGCTRPCCLSRGRAPPPPR